MIAIKSQARDCSRAISYPSVCDKCFKRYSDNGDILDTREKREKYLANSDNQVKQ